MSRIFLWIILFVCLVQGICEKRVVPEEVQNCKSYLTERQCGCNSERRNDEFCQKNCHWAKEFIIFGEKQCVYNDPSKYAAIYIVIYFLFLFYVLNVFWTLELPDGTERAFKNRKHLYSLNQVSIFDELYWTNMWTYVKNNVPTIGLLLSDPAHPISRTTNTIISYWGFAFSLLACVILYRLDDYDADVITLESWVIIVIVSLPNFFFPKLMRAWVLSEFDMSQRVSECEKCYNWVCCMPCWYFVLRPFGFCFKKRTHSCFKLLTPLQYWLMAFEVIILIYSSFYIGSMENPYCLFFLDSLGIGFIAAIVADIIFQCVAFCVKWRIEMDRASSVELLLCSPKCCRAPEIAETRFAPKSIDRGFAKEYSSGPSPINMIMPLTPEGYVTPFDTPKSVPVLDPNQSLANPSQVKRLRQYKSEPALTTKTKREPRTTVKDVASASSPSLSAPPQRTPESPKIKRIAQNDTGFVRNVKSSGNIEMESTQHEENSIPKKSSKSATSLELTL